MKKEEIEELLQEVKYNLRGGYNEVLVETLSKDVYELIDSIETQLSETEDKLKQVYSFLLEKRIYVDEENVLPFKSLKVTAQTWLEDKE